MKFLSKTLAIVALPFIGYLLLVVTPALAGHLDSKLRLGHHLLHTPASFFGVSLLTASSGTDDEPDLLKRHTQLKLSAMYLAGHPAALHDEEAGHILATLGQANYLRNKDNISLPSVYIAAIGFAGLRDGMCEALGARNLFYDYVNIEQAKHEEGLRTVNQIISFANKGASHPIPLDFEAFREWWFSYPDAGGVVCVEEGV